MERSIFYDYVRNVVMPQLQAIIDKKNGSRKELTYLHKDTSLFNRTLIQEDVYRTTTIDISYSAADFVSMDSPLPKKRRDTIEENLVPIPKIGMQKTLKESDLKMLTVLEMQGGRTAEIVAKLAQDAVACSTGIDERVEYSLLTGLSQGYVGIKDDASATRLNINYKYPARNKCGVAEVNKLTIDDLLRCIDTADKNGDKIITFWIAKSTFDALKQTDSAKKLVASYNGQTYTSETELPTPTTERLQEAFESETGVTFRIIDRSVRIEINGVFNAIRPWNTNYVIGVCASRIGTLVYSTCVEQTRPIQGAVYQIIDSYKLISKYAIPNPYAEVTCGQAFVLPVIEDASSIYQIDLTLVDNVVTVNTEAEEEDTEDETVTIGDNTYTKSYVIIALNMAGAGLKSTASDSEVIDAYNLLSAASKKRVLAALEEYIVSGSEDEENEEETDSDDESGTEETSE